MKAIGKLYEIYNRAFGVKLTRPAISILMPVYNPNSTFLSEAVASVLNQTFHSWELLIQNDASTNPEVAIELDDFAALDDRIKVKHSSVNSGIAGASQKCLERASGDWVTTLDQDDLLMPDALAVCFNELNSRKNVSFAYSNSCKMNSEGDYVEIFEKPDWSPERLRGNMYVAHLFIYRRDLAIKLGGYKSDLSGSQDHDLALRLMETGLEVIHILRTLYVWRMTETSTAMDPSSKPYAQTSGEIAIQNHLDRIKIDGRVSGVDGYPGFYEIKREPKTDQMVSIVIPTRGTKSEIFGEEKVLLINAINSMQKFPQKTNYEIVVVADRTENNYYLEEAATLLGNRLVVVDFNEKFNFSRKVNAGVRQASGDKILLLNDDIQIISDNWLDQMVAIMDQDDVGAVGPLLFFENEQIQHGGHFYAWGGATHKYLRQEINPGYFGDLIIEHEVSGLTGAYLMFSKSDFENVGGWTEDFPNNFNDVDFCLKLRSYGKRLIFTPLVSAYHFESLTRKAVVETWEGHLLNEKWGYFLGSQREPFGPGGKPPLFGLDPLNLWRPYHIYKALRRIAGNIKRGRRPIFKIS